MTEFSALFEALKARGLTLASAESCTGGMFGAALTAIPGSSAVYPGGVVSYSCAVKHGLLSVPQEELDAFGAVSPQVAESMARGVRAVCGASVGVSVTGLAGPDGDGSGRPVGLVYIGFADESGAAHCELHLRGSRAEIRQAACREAAAFALRRLG